MSSSSSSSSKLFVLVVAAICFEAVACGGYGVLHLDESDEEADRDAPMPEEDVVVVVKFLTSSRRVSFEHDEDFSLVEVENASREEEHVHLLTFF